MRILVSWLRDFVAVPSGIDELAHALHMRGFELAAVLPPPAGVGSDLPDAVLDLDITTNRPDCLSVMGIAREVATIYDLPLRPAALAPDEVPTSAARGGVPLRVTIEDDELCPRYAASLSEVRIARSPTWLAARLEAAGVRPINTVVDVTNYVMLELGHPMHAFDFEKLGGGELRIRRARAGERIRTLDNVVRELTPDMLAIADRDRPQAVAGVIGGADSEVETQTRMVAFESAYFQPLSVRRTSKRLGLSTDASYRFERGADIDAPVAAIRRAHLLLEQIGAGRPSGRIIDRFPSRRTRASVSLRHSRISRVLGQAIDGAFVSRTLGHLGFGVQAQHGADGTVWEIDVPSFRVDVSREIDLIEEVARHHGYDKLPTTFPALTESPPRPGPWRNRNRLIRKVLTAAGCSEAITYGFIERAAALAFHPQGHELVAIANPLSEKFGVLRPSLIPGLLDSLIRNRRRERRDVRLFEIGNIYRRSSGERPSVALAWTGAGTVGHWSGGDRLVDFFDVQGIVERLCGAFGVPLQFRPAQRPDLVAGRTARAISGETEIGYVGQLVGAIAVERGLPGPGEDIYVAELDLGLLDRLTRRGDVRVEPLPRYPSIVRDLSIVVADTLFAESIRGTIQAAAGRILIGVREFDRYQGRGVPAGSVSLSFRLTFRAPDRTLTDAEVQRAVDAVVGSLEATWGAKLR